MMRSHPIAWATLHIALASAATYLLYSTDALTAAAPFLIH